MASYKGHKAVAELWIQNGARVSQPDDQESTPIHDASMRGFFEIVKLLIENGAQVNGQQKDDKTPLYFSFI